MTTKDEMKNRISMALKDPILQQGFEIICREIADLENENAELKVQVEKLQNENKEIRKQEVIDMYSRFPC